MTRPRRSWFKSDNTFNRTILRRAAKPETKAHAKQLRDNPTHSEALVWKELRLLPTRFRRSCVILGWIADFYHAKSKTVIEIDGGYHLTPEQIRKDDHRDSVMRSRGLNVIRFTNEKVLSDLSGVIRTIVSKISSPESQPQGSPVGGGSRSRPGERNEGPAGSPTVPSAIPMYGE